MQGAIEYPYSHLDFSEGGIYAPHKDNYPGFQHVFFCDAAHVTPATGRLNDASELGFGNIVLGSSTDTALTVNANGSVSLGTTLTAIKSGAWALPAGKHVVFIVVARPTTTSGWTVGSTSSVGGFNIPQVSATGFATVHDGTNSRNTGAPGLAANAGALQTRITSIRWNNATGLNASAYNGSVWADGTAGDLATPSMTDITTLNAVTIGGALDPVFALVGYFTKLPSFAWLKAQAAWMHARCAEATPRKLISPGFRGMA